MGDAKVTLTGEWLAKQLFGHVIDCQERHGTDVAIKWDGLPHSAAHHYLRASVIEVSGSTAPTPSIAPSPTDVPKEADNA